MADVKHLRIERGSIKGRVTSFKNYLDNLSHEFTPEILCEVNKRYTTIEPVLEQFYEKHLEILLSLDESLIEAEDQKKIEFENIYFSTMAHAACLLDDSMSRPSTVLTAGNISLATAVNTKLPIDLNNTNNSTNSCTNVAQSPAQGTANVGTNAAPPVFNSQSNSQSAVTNSSNLLNSNNINPVHNLIHLPKIKLPTFSGVHEAWLEFRDKFTSLIHANTAIPEIQKFDYLRSCLSGEAAGVISHFSFASNNYVDAWDILCKRYNNSRMLMHNHLRSLFSLESLHKESSSKLRSMLDNMCINLSALEQLKQPSINLFDTLIIFIITSKFDSVTARDWEQCEASKSNSLASLTDLKNFMRDKADLLSSIELKRATDKTNNTAYKQAAKYNQTPNKHQVQVHVANSSTSIKCPMCKSNHFLRACPDFVKLSPSERYTKIKSMNRCINCLRYGHSINACDSSSCQTCGKKHHTMLHFDSTQPSDKQLSANLEQNSSPSTSNSTAVYTANVNLNSLPNPSNILLSTIMVCVYDKFHRPHKVRVLLDNASQSNFITQSLADKLQLPSSYVDMNVTGILELSSTLSSYCQTKLKSIHSEFYIDTKFLITPCITTPIPSYRLNRNTIHIPSNLSLADPLYHEPGHIDILIGAEHFWSLLCIGQIRTTRRGPILQKTKFGWIVVGTAAGTSSSSTTSCNLVQATEETCNLNNSLKRFWEIEEISSNQTLSASDLASEKHFVDTVSRDSDGRFVVTIPIDNLASLGDTKDIAFKRYLNLERKLNRQPAMQQLYNNFMLEYLSLGHMTAADSSDDPVYYLPHHCVVNNNSSTTKLRVVFDGSALPSHGKSLNQLQPVGPVLQDDLFAILVRFRIHSFVASADIEKMYRQVLVAPHQRSLQRIFWRPTPEAQVSAYNLNTVTYGTTSASYLAIRCLFEVANNSHLSADVANIIRHDFYVDDLLTGSDNIEELQKLITNVSSALNDACFPLRKWTSNAPEVLRDFPIRTTSSIQFCPEETSKTLGLLWKSISDTLHYRINNKPLSAVTKRTILSAIAQIFDPLGLLSPVTIVAKSFVQSLWRCGVNWDESIPTDIYTEWTNFYNSLSVLNNRSIPRHASCIDSVKVELHGFCDASEKGYGACLYLKSFDALGAVKTSLLCSKAKVAPLKTLTIPRLELCGALLLAKLASAVINATNISFSSQTMWCDSTIVLAWIQTCPSKLQTFVSHRISKIQNLTEAIRWRHVPTAYNPADLASRGVSTTALLESDLWWFGPPWLSLSSEHWPDNIITNHENLEFRSRVLLAPCGIKPCLNNLIDYNRFSSLRRLETVVCYVFRFIFNMRNRASCRRIGLISIDERNHAHRTLIMSQQNLSFSNEISALKNGKCIESSSKILALSPILDRQGVLRVGGRLSNSRKSFGEKHQILLPHNNSLTKLIFRSEHIRTLHIGPLGLLHSIRQRYWPISGRNIARTTVRNCVICFRANPKPILPIMGDLPVARVTPSPPFDKTGVDYAGPVSLKTTNRRGCKTFKAYIAVFVCFCTKAIHLELVSSLSTDSFIAALRRFIARRGRPRVMHSDNGTNFVGANRELKELAQFLKTNSEAVCDSVGREGIVWKFIPARSPHFGGIWEAGVKCVKYHLRRTLNGQALTFEDFYTLLVQIEAILNSRPLTPLSSDPNDLSPITPAHLLVGRHLLTVEDKNYTDTPISHLSRYQHIQQMVRTFWSRWSKEFLNELQRRTKWRTGGQPNTLCVGSLVLLMEDNLPPQHWKLGRIVDLHRGKDDVVRVVSITTNGGNVVKRATHRICPLPVDDELDELRHEAHTQE